MSETNRLTELLKKSYESEAWHGPSLRETLDGVDVARAAAKPIPGAHSIWELVLHVAGWDDVVRRRLQGEHVLEPEAGDFPAIDATDEAAWRAALDRLAANEASLRELVETIEECALPQVPENNTTPRYVSLYGVLQHRAYHAGQIALLKKAV